MVILVLLDEKWFIDGKMMNCIWMLKKHQQNDDKHLKFLKEGDLVLWLPKDLKIKEGKLKFP
jgi:hypothetical protein